MDVSMGNRLRHIRTIFRTAIWCFFISHCLDISGQPEATVNSLNLQAYDALQRDQPGEALDYVNEALGLALGTDRYDAIADSYLWMAEAYRKLGQFGGALKAYFQALNALEKYGDDQSRAIVFTEIGMLYEELNVHEKAVEHYRAALKIREEIGNTTGAVINREQLGRCYVILDSTENALQVYTQLREVYRDEGEVFSEIQCLKKIAELYKQKRQIYKALGHNDEIRQLAQEVGDTVEIASALNQLGSTFSSIGNFAQALVYYRQSLALHRQFAEVKTADIAIDYTNLGKTFLQVQNYTEANKILREGIDYAEKKELFPDAAGMYFLMAKSHFDRNAYQDAILAIQQAIKLAKKHAAPEILRDSYLLYGQILQERKEYQSAINYFQQHIKVKDSLFNIERINEQSASQQQVSFERTERQLRILLADEDIREMELRQLQLEQDKQQSELQLLQREGQLKELALKQEATFKRQALQELQLAQERIESARRDQEILELQQNKKLNALALQQTQLETEKKSQAIRLLEQEREQQQMRAIAGRREKRVAIAILGLALGILVLLSIGYLQTQRARRVISKQKEQVEKNKEELEHALRDLTLTHHQLQKAQTQLVDSEKMASLGQLTAGIAHEINNPINFVGSNISPLKRDFEDIEAVFKMVEALENSQDLNKDVAAILNIIKDRDITFLFEEVDMLLNGIEEGANRTKEIVLGLRTFSRMDEDDFKDADIHQGLDSTLTLLGNKLKNRIEVHKDYGNLPTIQCLPGKINQVFMNILTNAIQAIESEGAIYIKTAFEDGSASKDPFKRPVDKVNISIRDTGKGMDMATAKRIFEPFFTTKPVGEGTGLGLSITYGIIEQHKGSIQVESEPGKGTTFVIKLPVKYEQPSA